MRRHAPIVVQDIVYIELALVWTSSHVFLDRREVLPRWGLPTLHPINYPPMRFKSTMAPKSPPTFKRTPKDWNAHIGFHRKSKKINEIDTVLNRIRELLFFYYKKNSKGVIMVSKIFERRRDTARLWLCIFDDWTISTQNEVFILLKWYIDLIFYYFCYFWFDELLFATQWLFIKWFDGSRVKRCSIRYFFFLFFRLY